MPQAAGRLERKSADASAFGQWLRTGRPPLELKFNPNHDPADGRFTSGPGGTGGGQDIGTLSARYETGHVVDPGRVSSGRGDPGGPSYGSYQLSSKKGTAAEFLASPEARRWAAEFHGLSPGSAAFGDRWRKAAATDPQAFQMAQKAFVERRLFGGTASAVKLRTGYDAANSSEAVREVVYSTAVQHGASGGARIVAEAVRRADRGGSRDSIDWHATLIDTVYEERTKVAESQRMKAIREGDAPKAREFDNIIRHRYPEERKDALSMLRSDR